MLQRKLDHFCAEQRPVWVFLRDQQRWIEEALVVDVQGDMVTLRYDDADEEELHSWEESVRLDSIGAVSTRLSRVSRSLQAEDLPITGECPDAERLGQSGTGSV